MRLTVTDNVGERSTSNASVQVAGTVTAAFTATPVADRVVNFDASASTGSGLSYTWNFGDGDPTTVSSAMITHAFVDDGPRNVVLTVTDIEGTSASITQSVTPPAL
jgi:PKD repeat protein